MKMANRTKTNDGVVVEEEGDRSEPFEANDDVDEIDDQGKEREAKIVYSVPTTVPNFNHSFKLTLDLLASGRISTNWQQT